MQTMNVNGYELVYLDVGSAAGNGPPLVLVHGTLGDFRTWNAVIGPLSTKHRVISLSLRRFFPEHWNGIGDDFLISQHIADVIGFIEKLDAGPVDLMGHSRGGHIGFRVAQARPDLLHRLVLAEPGGELEPALLPASPPPGPVPLGPRVTTAAELVQKGDIDGALALFVDGVDGDGAWARWPAAARQQLRDNVRTLIGQVNEDRKPYLMSEAQSIVTPTLLIGGGDTKGHLAVNWRVLAEHIPGARTAVIPGTRHWMFDHAPQEFCAAVLEFLDK